ncbi:MAG: hypothetical protein LWY06_05835 [Firmicutes bacterium]|nr:hypothetical protein [Bacillota bacterium]
MCIHLVVDKQKIIESARHKDFYRLNFSSVWKNSLEKEFGAFSVISPESLENVESEYFGNGELIFVSSSCRDISSSAISRFLSFAESGGIVVVETPSALWNIGFSDVIISTQIRNINQEKGLYASASVCGDWNEYLPAVPVVSRLCLPEKNSDPENILLTFRNQPAIIKKSWGKGAVIFLMFDFCMALTALKQGIPSQGSFRVKKKHGRLPFITETEDLAINEDMLTADAPYADILEKFVFAVIEEVKPIPRIWYFPFGYDGAFLMSHDDEKRGKKKSGYMIEAESELGCISTFFATCPPGAGKRWQNAKQDITGKGFEIGWHWNRFPDNFRVIPPEEQINHFMEITGNPPESCRLHFLNWGSDYTYPFRIMEKLGLKQDSSYGPNRGRGYVFGTGMPFHPITEEGGLFNILEIPFQTQENWGGADGDYSLNLLRNSGEKFHCVITALFHPHKIAAGTGRELWLGFFRNAGLYNHWITTFDKLGDFYRRRQKLRFREIKQINDSLNCIFEWDNDGVDAEPAYGIRVYTGKNSLISGNGIRMEKSGNNGGILNNLSSESGKLMDLGREYTIIKISG